MLINFRRKPPPIRSLARPRRQKSRRLRVEYLEPRAMLSVNGDFNGDGFDDLAIGVPFENVAGVTDCGAVNVIYGSADGLIHAGNQFWHQGVPGVNGVPAVGDRFGAGLAVGDFNGDGFSDLAIGAPGKAIGGNAIAGAVNILYGSAAGLTASGDQQWSQDSSGINDTAEIGDAFGTALAAGDFNGDGRDDLAIGVPGENTGGADGAGMVNVLYGSASGLTNVDDQHWHQNSSGINDVAAENERFGITLAAGDFDGDGRDDLAVGVPGEAIGAATEAGMVNVIYGSASGLTATDDQTWHQDSSGINDVAQTGEEFGRALAAGDFNNDGRDDLAIGVPNETVSGFAEAGMVQVINGSASGLTNVGDVDWNQDSPEGIFDVADAGDQFGLALAVGDFDGDGFDDLAVGAPFEDIDGATDVGVAHVLFGGAAGISSNNDVLWHQGSSNVPGASEDEDVLGLSLVMGDYDGDGRADLVLGIPGEDVGAVVNAGAILVIYGHGLIDPFAPIWHQDLLDSDNDVGMSDFFALALG